MSTTKNPATVTLTLTPSAVAKIKELDDDIVLDTSGVRVFVDPFSAQYLNGVEVDHVTTMQASGFAFRNPNAAGGCGCGSSFTA